VSHDSGPDGKGKISPRHGIEAAVGRDREARGDEIEGQGNRARRRRDRKAGPKEPETEKKAGADGCDEQAGKGDARAAERHPRSRDIEEPIQEMRTGHEQEAWAEGDEPERRDQPEPVGEAGDRAREEGGGERLNDAARARACQPAPDDRAGSAAEHVRQMQVEKDHIQRGGAHSIDAGGAGVSNDDTVGRGNV
jgi:hypothetical protein